MSILPLIIAYTVASVISKHPESALSAVELREITGDAPSQVVCRAVRRP
jgi:hypothetical protein